MLRGISGSTSAGCPHSAGSAGSPSARRGDESGGQTAAGKSTLINVISGVYGPEQGTVFVRGKPVAFGEPAEALKMGIATVHQHSSLAGNLTVARNLVLGREPGARMTPFLVTKRATLRAARGIMERVGINLPLGALASDLSVAQRQRVEIVRAAAEAEPSSSSMSPPRL